MISGPRSAMFETVLLPITARQQAGAAAAQALELALTYSSRLVLLAVMEPDRPARQDSNDVAPWLEPTRGQMLQAGVPCAVIQRQGDPADVIGAVADELNVDVIVMGIGGVALNSDDGSTAARVIQHADCAVLVVP